MKYNPKMNSKEYNEYNKFINKIFPESKPLSIFSGLFKYHLFNKCKCKYLIEEYIFYYFINHKIDLYKVPTKCHFSEILKFNLPNNNNFEIKCPKCNRKIKLKEEIKIIKLPEILILTFERNKNIINNINIKPDNNIDLTNYIDDSLKSESAKYELFAINFLFGVNSNLGYFCQVKRKGKWYEINDRFKKEIKDKSFKNCYYGLFYKKK